MSSVKTFRRKQCRTKRKRKYRKTRKQYAGVKTQSLSSYHNNPIDLTDKLDKLLRNCKTTEAMVLNINKPACKYGKDCMRINPTHFRSYSHPQGGLTETFKQCSEKFIELSYHIFQINNDSFPTDWYVVMAKYLREQDFTRYDSLYFNILANLCIYHKYYSNTYPNKHFWSSLYMGLEEGAAVTGMYNVSNIPKLSRCLNDMNSVDKKYLSNTALIFSKSYGKQ